MTSALQRLTSLGLILALSGCAALNPLLSTPEPVSVSQATATPQPLPTTTIEAPIAERDTLLRVWLPVSFDPSSDSESARLLNERLNEFASSYTQIKLDVRLKPVTGEQGLLNALTLTNSAASSALPDLLLLPRPEFESAALAGLLHPLDGLSSSLEDSTWHPYARELAHIQGVDYGLPFAADALILLHRPDHQFATWDELIAQKEPLLFFANDSQGLFGLSLYLSAGGSLLNEQGQPTLEEAPLIRALTLVQNGMTAGTLPPFVLNFESESQVLDAYRDGRANQIVIWASQRGDESTNIIAPLFSLESPHTFASGWLWALAGEDPEKQKLAIELAEFLTQPEFANEWADSAGYFPVRAPAEIHPALASAQAIPSNETLAVLGPLMQQALARILNGDQPDVVARGVIEGLTP